MAPSIPTRRPLLTPTRLTGAIAVAAVASSVYLMLYVPSADASPPAALAPDANGCGCGEPRPVRWDPHRATAQRAAS